MKIYHYDAFSKIFVGEGTADESPLEPGVWLVPANATDVEPPAVSAEEVAVWKGEKGWVVESIPEPEPEPEKPVPPTPQEVINRDNRAYLNQTDWYVIRQMETGEPVPEEITAARAEARAAIVE